MKKLFSFVCAALFSASMLADTAILSWNLGENGTAATPDSVTGNIVGAAGSAAEGWTIAMDGKADGKVMAPAMDSTTINGVEYWPIKNSNGKKITVTLPEGLYASKVEFYAITNDESTKGTLKEFDGAACKDTVHSLKDYENPTYIAKELEMPKNEFSFLFGGKQVCFVAFVTYSDQEPVTPLPVALLSWMLGENGAEATAANSITGAAGSAAEGWTIAMADGANWAGSSKITYKGTQYKSLKNSNGKQITVTLPEGFYATQVEFYAVTNADDAKGTLKEFDGVACRDSVESLKDYSNPTRIVKELATPKNEFTFLFGGKQVCFIAAVSYTDEAPVTPVDPGEGIEDVKTENKARKIIRDGQLIIIRDGKEFNAIGTQL